MPTQERLMRPQVLWSCRLLVRNAEGQERLLGSCLNTLTPKQLVGFVPGAGRQPYSPPEPWQPGVCSSVLRSLRGSSGGTDGPFSVWWSNPERRVAGWHWCRAAGHQPLGSLLSVEQAGSSSGGVGRSCPLSVLLAGSEAQAVKVALLAG